MSHLEAIWVSFSKSLRLSEKSVIKMGSKPVSKTGHRGVNTLDVQLLHDLLEVFNLVLNVTAATHVLLPTER